MGTPDQLISTLSVAYLARFGHYPPIHRMPDDLALESIRGALKDGEPLPQEPFAGSGCNCA